MHKLDQWNPLFEVMQRHFRNPRVFNEQLQSCRIFHGRGGVFPELQWCVVDDFNPTILVTVFQEPPQAFMDCLVSFVRETWQTLEQSRWQNLAVQLRYVKHSPVEWLIGSEPNEAFAYRHSQRFKIRFDRQNTGFFLDMEPGRQWLQARAKGANILNLFAFTCAFSPIAIAAGAEQITNVDMSRSALSEGRLNHHINNLSTANVHFMPLDILKSWSRIKKFAPYNIVIIDPPSFQKGSFIATRDYAKIIKRLDQLTSTCADALLCLNAPEIESQFLFDIMADHGKSWHFVERLRLDDVFQDRDNERQLKLLHFKRMPINTCLE